MAEERKRLRREEGTVRPRRTGRVVRSRSDEDRLARDEDRVRSRRRRRDEDGDDGEERVEHRRRRRRDRLGRPPLRDEFMDLGRGSSFVATETVAIALDIASRVLRGAVDNAFDEDYSEPGDVIRGVTNEADLAAYDLVDELRRVPRRLDRRFEDGIRSPRAERGERVRRSDD